MLRPFVILALAATAYAQLGALGSLSTQCQGSVTGLLTTPFASCSSLISLAGVLTTTGSVITPLESWLNQVCVKTCSESDIQSAVTVVESACSTDISNGNVLAGGLRDIIANFQVEQKALCLQSTANSTYCVSQLLTSVQSTSGSNLGLDSFLSLFTNSSSLLATLTPSTVCTDCNYGLAAALSPIEGINATLVDPLRQTCGTSFNAQIPSTVSSKSNTPAASSSAAPASTGTSAPASTPTGGAGRLGVGAVGAALLSVAVGVLTLA